jgi:hypothetical protein
MIRKPGDLPGIEILRPLSRLEWLLRVVVALVIPANVAGFSFPLPHLQVS